MPGEPHMLPYAAMVRGVLPNKSAIDRDLMILFAHALYKTKWEHNLLNSKSLRFFINGIKFKDFLISELILGLLKMTIKRHSPHNVSVSFGTLSWITIFKKFGTMSINRETNQKIVNIL